MSFTRSLIYTQHHCLFQNKKLKIKYQHVFEKFKESLDLCGKLQDDIVCLTANKKPTAKHLVDGSTQTDKPVRYYIRSRINYIESQVKTIKRF